MAQLLYGNQYFTTTLNVGGGINDSQTTGIILTDVSGVDTAKPGMILINYSDPINTSLCEWIEYTSINGSKELVGVTRGSEGFSAKSHSNGVTIAFPVTESHINRLADMFTTGGHGFTEISTPANPSSGFLKIYAKTDDKLYKLTSAGVESELGAGGTAAETFIIPGTLATGTDLAKTWYLPFNCKISSATAYVKTAGTTNSTVFDINLDGSTIFTDKPTIVSGGTSDSATADNPTSTRTAGSKITIDIDSVSTTAPVEAYIVLFYERV